MNTELILSEETISNTIYYIRNQKVMLDRDLATLYGIETKRLKEQVKRNITRFPVDFMFELTKIELENWRSQFATSNSDKMGLRYAPMAFTEHGILMLSSVLNSDKAILPEAEPNGAKLNEYSNYEDFHQSETNATRYYRNKIGYCANSKKIRKPGQKHRISFFLFR
jgi:hypothetical protein